ncbi:hypothetical protein MRB53_020581 [Persea americana]|uniref:Uncharacterized protein n=1 Tax=Persea americana TaxID=3435 RepID=A0ACC2L1E8_PERAE|nr:hypothetical protein MRB53_020581 [Persea americana]
MPPFVSPLAIAFIPWIVVHVSAFAKPMSCVTFSGTEERNKKQSCPILLVVAAARNMKPGPFKRLMERVFCWFNLGKPPNPTADPKSQTKRTQHREREKASSFFRDPAQSERQNPLNLRDETLSTLLSVLEKYSLQKPDDEAVTVPAREALSTLFSNRNPLHRLLQSKPDSFFRDIPPKISMKPFSGPSSPFLRNPFWRSPTTMLPSPIKKTDDETLSTIFSVFEKYSSEKPDDDAAMPTRRREVSIIVFPVFFAKLDDVLGDGLFNADDGFTDSSLSGEFYAGH